MRPRLIHPVEVTFQRADADNTEWDDTFKEPVEDTDVVYKDPETVKAQVHFNDFERREMAAQGEIPLTSGYILYRRGSIPSLRKGDKITAIAGIPTEVYVISVEPAAASGGGFGLEMALFQERRRA